MLERARYPQHAAAAAETSRLGHFSGTLASSDFCNCMINHLTQLTCGKSEM
jgi:hypothetical protein